jgi:AraC-like DNA-binding protein
MPTPSDFSRDPSRDPSRSTLSSWSATIVRALDGEGFDGTAIAARAGIDSAALADPNARVPREALTRLWELAVEQSGDRAFGLVAARYTMQTTFHALGYAVLASATLREALGRIIRHRRLIGEIIQLRLEDLEGRSRFFIDVSAGRGIVPWAAVDAVVAILVRQAALLTGNRSFAPLAISLQRPAPEDTSAYERALRTPVLFGQRATFLDYSAKDLDSPLPAANAELARQNDEVVVRYLARHAEHDVLRKTREALLESLPSGAPTKPQIARRLGTSARSLQRLLATQRTSFKEMLAEARLVLAKNYLDEGRLAVTEIAFVLGFADTSAFSRAFKRWTGLAPSEYAKSSPAGRERAQ